MQIQEICSRLEQYLSRHDSLESRIDVGVAALTRIFGVGTDEVAIFSYHPEQELFTFIWPKEMRTSGTIPASANRSLVAVTASERRGILNNSFVSTPHLFVFERFAKENVAQIQKIMSVPMLRGGELRGVIQVCRKGEDEGSLRSFSQQELAALGEMASTIAGYL